MFDGSDDGAPDDAVIGRLAASTESPTAELLGLSTGEPSVKSDTVGRENECGVADDRASGVRS